MLRTFVLIFITLLTISCKRESDVKKFAKAEGWQSYKVEGYCWLCCSEDETFHTEFTAITKEGKTITGAVCSGIIFKNSTMRLD